MTDIKNLTRTMEELVELTQMDIDDYESGSEELSDTLYIIRSHMESIRRMADDLITHITLMEEEMED